MPPFGVYNNHHCNIIDLSNPWNRKKLPDSRVLHSFVRVGPLAKGLLLRGDLAIHLVVLCSEKPTRTLLDTVVDRITKHLQVVDCFSSFLERFALPDETVSRFCKTSSWNWDFISVYYACFSVAKCVHCAVSFISGREFESSKPLSLSSFSFI